MSSAESKSWFPFLRIPVWTTAALDRGAMGARAVLDAVAILAGSLRLVSRARSIKSERAQLPFARRSSPVQSPSSFDAVPAHRASLPPISVAARRAPPPLHHEGARPVPDPVPVQLVALTSAAELPSTILPDAEPQSRSSSSHSTNASPPSSTPSPIPITTSQAPVRVDLPTPSTSLPQISPQNLASVVVPPGPGSATIMEEVGLMEEVGNTVVMESPPKVSGNTCAVPLLTSSHSAS